MKAILFSALSLAAAASSAHAVIVGTTDTFQDLTVQGWEGANPINIATGGPAGVGDAFLNITSIGGTGPSSRLAADNPDARWNGDYLAAGVTWIEADFLNMGTVPLEMRLVLFHGINERYTSTAAGAVPADGLWHHLVFGVGSASLTQVNGTWTYQEVLSAVDNVMFRHQTGLPEPGGTAIASSLGIDNIHLAPSPGAAVLLAFACVRRRPRRS